MLERLKQEDVRASLGEHIFKKNLRFYEWVDKSFEEKRAARLSSANWSLQNHLDPRFSDGNKYRYNLIIKNNEFCNFINETSFCDKHRGLSEFRQYFEMIKNFPIRFLRYEEVHKRMLSLLSIDDLVGELEKRKNSNTRKVYKLIFICQ